MSLLTVDPYNITDYNRTTDQLEAVLLFAVSVAGKTASQISAALDRFLAGYEGSPFSRVKQMIAEGVLEQKIRDAKLGKHRTLSRAYREMVDANLDLRNCSPEDLETIHGIGFKTSRFFLLHTRKNAQIAALDTHQLKFLRSIGIDAPKNTPASQKQYKRLEEAYLNHLRQIGVKNIAEFDLNIWRQYAKPAKS